MTYELAKQQLKDKGYTGEFDLSSLVEACGKNIKNIDFLHDINLVVAYSQDSINMQGRGSTPEEAVAKLWLELNK